jgi:quinoprotein dehydrogenase-associated probable ABC transporter substrate-binding protein
MYSSFRSFVCIVTFLITCSAFARDLRVCADPDNLPFSNKRQQGFENRIAELMARDLHASLVYQWQRMGRGFVRDYLNASQCDVLIGIPANFKPVLTTSPYYRSTYVFVTPRDSHVKPASLDDPSLHQLKIGVQVLQEDYTPPATALARRHMQNQIVGFDTTGEDADSIIRAVADRKVDTAIVWGPLAGFFAKKKYPGLELTPVAPQVDPPALPFTFAIAMGVRKGNTALRDELEAVIEKRQGEINAILDRYGVPRLEMAPRLAAETHGGPQ